jgi:hypothetical protein
MTRALLRLPLVLGCAAIALLGTMRTPAVWADDLVLPPDAEPHGYSLTDMAAATAVFNTGGVRSPQTLPPTPFQILYTPTNGPQLPFDVSQGTTFYLPLLYSDDSPPVVGDFPKVNNQEKVEHYCFGQKEIGIVYADIVIDGVSTLLGEDYAVGVTTPPLPDGGGRHYITVAAFLSPMSKGHHTVVFRFLATGKALLDFPDFYPSGIWEFEGTYDIHVH